MTPRVAVNMLWSVPGVGGSEEYLVRQLHGLAAIDSGFEVHVFVPRGFSARRPDAAGLAVLHEAPSSAARRTVRIALEHSWLVTQTRSFDLVHHGGGTVPRVGNATTLLTIHDIQWIDYPDYVSATKLRYLRAMVPASIARARRVAVPSAYVAGTLVDAFGVDPSRIAVVRHGLESSIDHHVTPADEVRGKFGLGDGPVLVYPANTHPHKNHRFVLELMASADSVGTDDPWCDPRLRVVFAGSPGRAECDVRAAVRRLGLASRVVMPGRVSDADRNGLLSVADAMIFPSEYEGFGAPVIEAMRFGVPVICSDRASLPEVAGDAAVVAPLVHGAWRAALRRVRSERSALVVAGHERAKNYTAQKSAEDLVVQYESVLRSVR